MIRRALLALVAVAALASCSTFDRDRVAAVNGTELDEETLDEMLDNDFTRQALQRFVADHVAKGDDARLLIQTWTWYEAYDQAGILDPADRDSIRAGLEQRFGDLWQEAPAELQELAVRSEALNGLGQEGRINSDQLATVLDEADVEIASRYGYWNPDTYTVDPLGVPPPAE